MPPMGAILAYSHPQVFIHLYEDSTAPFDNTAIRETPHAACHAILLRSSAMRHSPIVGTEIISRTRLVKRGFFALVFEALYNSRRVRAERTLRRYRDVIGQARIGILRELNTIPKV
jgi:hypothetical protein